MTIRDRREIKQTAAAALDRATYDPKRLVLIYAGVTVALYLLLLLLDQLFQAQLDHTSGISGIGTRSLLKTASVVLNLSIRSLSPFWAIGFLATMLRIAKDKYVSQRSLMLGFQNFGPVLRMTLLQSFLTIMVALFSVQMSVVLFLVICVQLGTSSFFLLPQSQLQEILSGSAADTSSAMADPAMQEAISAITPLLLILFLGIFLLIYTPISYRLRMSRYLLMDVPGIGALAAIIHSFRMTKGKCFQLFRLDLSFWWYYLALVLAAVIDQLPLLLSAFGIILPISGNTLFWLSTAVYSLVYLGVNYLAADRVQTTYAVAYGVVKEPYRASFRSIRN